MAIQNLGDPAVEPRRSTSPGARRRRRNPQRRLAPYLFIAPFFVFFVALLVTPVVYSAYLTLFVERIIGGSQFAGAENYIRVLTDPDFLGGVGRIVLFFVIQVPIALALSLFFALALDSGLVRGSKVLRLIIFVPYAVPGVVATLMWGYLYGNDFGPIAQLFTAIGLPSPDLLSERTILVAIANIVSWEFVGYNMIVLYAALRAVPTELYEAAEIDGAGQIRIAWSIKIPAIRSAIGLSMIFSIIGSFQLFNEPALLKIIAPGAISASFTPNYYAYNVAFTNQETNYAATIAVVLGVIIMVVSYAFQLATQRRERRA